MTDNRITVAIRALQSELTSVCARCKRDPTDITIVAVTKTRTPAEINTALQAGITVIGENRAQEALVKLPELYSCERHFIGHLQTNKTREIITNFDCIESVDSLRLAEKINVECQRLDKKFPIFLQVNLANEETKSGFSAVELKEVVPKIRELQNLNLIGIMVIGPHTADKTAIKNVFERGKRLTLQYDLPQYSAGMSSDWQLAVMSGATHLRLGQAIFG